MTGLLEEPLIQAEDDPGDPPTPPPDPPPTKLPNDTDPPEGDGFRRLREEGSRQLAACAGAIKDLNTRYDPAFRNS